MLVDHQLTKEKVKQKKRQAEDEDDASISNVCWILRIISLSSSGITVSAVRISSCVATPTREHFSMFAHSI